MHWAEERRPESNRRRLRSHRPGLAKGSWHRKSANYPGRNLSARRPEGEGKSGSPEENAQRDTRRWDIPEAVLDPDNRRKHRKSGEPEPERGAAGCPPARSALTG